MNIRRLILAGLVLIGCVTAILAAPRAVGPGMTLTFNSAIKDTRIYIENARLPNGGAFPHSGTVGGGGGPSSNPLKGGATMSAAPDGRQLPEYVDFEWRENPYPGPPDPTPMDPFSEANKEWREKSLADLLAQPIKSQRVFIRNRVPSELLNKVIEANRHSVKGHGAEASIGIYFIWTDYGIKLRWHIWYTPAYNGQYYSDEGGDEIVPSGTTMIAAYSNSIKND